MKNTTTQTNFGGLREAYRGIIPLITPSRNPELREKLLLSTTGAAVPPSHGTATAAPVAGEPTGLVSFVAAKAP